MRKTAVTLIEVMVVVVIIGILAAVAIVMYSGPKEQMIEKEARTSLKLIAAAEKMYWMEERSYVEANDTGEVNQRLRLQLPADASAAKWDYTIDAGNDWFRVNASRINPSTGHGFFINETLPDASAF